MTPLCWHVLKQDNVKANLEHQLSCNSCQTHASVTHSTSHEKKADEATHVMYAQETPGMTCTEGKISQWACAYTFASARRFVTLRVGDSTHRQQ